MLSLQAWYAISYLNEEQQAAETKAVGPEEGGIRESATGTRSGKASRPRVFCVVVVDYLQIFSVEGKGGEARKKTTAYSVH